MAILLTREEVASAVSMAEAIPVLEQGFRAEARGEVSLPPRLTTRVGKGWLRLMPGVLSSMGFMGFKAMNLCPGIGVRYVLLLYTLVDGALQAIMDAEGITTQRTAAVSAVATKRLARSDACKVGAVGSGAEARAQLEAIATVRSIESVKVFSPNPDHRERFADEMSRLLAVRVQAVASARDAVRGTDLVLLAVKATEPAFCADWLESGMHVNSIGSVRPEQREIDSQTFVRSDLVVFDSRAEVMTSGDGVAAQSDGFDGSKCHELWELVGGTRPGRIEKDAITLFKSVGSALQDLVLAKKIYEVARERDLGRRLGDFPHLKPAG
jgi:alanine dehydrogenase